MDKSKYLTDEHPSYGCEQAWFLFAVKSPRGPGFCRLLLVEAKSHSAVSFIERVAGEDGHVSPTCVLMTVHRQCPSIGIRSDLTEEVAFVDFAADIVDHGLVERDPLAAQALREALSASPEGQPDGERNYEDALSALTGLGFSKPQAAAKLKTLRPRAGSMSVEELIRQGLQGAAS